MHIEIDQTEEMYETVSKYKIMKKEVIQRMNLSVVECVLLTFNVFVFYIMTLFGQC